VVAKSRFLPRGEAGLNHLVLFGSPYERGLAAGRLTSALLRDEETALVGELNRFFPNALGRWALELGAMRWFAGIDRYFYPWATDEMYGVAQAADPAFDYLTDGFTRQVAYHGVHEIGQMFVDFERQDFGCTALAVPWRGGVLLGRNFDFEAVRLLDTEKVAKWVFPDAGHAFVAVTWAGMVGVVTGVNDAGVYVSINAAGTADFRRYGTPTTLVALNALTTAATAAEAARLIAAADVFISDLFVVADRGSPGIYVVEKTPRRAKVTFRVGPAAVTNHFTAPEFAADKINAFRMREQTTVARLARATELVTAWRPPASPTPAVAAAGMAALLRDKRSVGGAPLHLGNRQALDALIATHSVVYDAPDFQLWISQGPALTGPYLGYDLARSFTERRPVRSTDLPADPDLAPGAFAELKTGLSDLREAKADLKAGRCAAAGEQLAAIAATPAAAHYEYLMAAGDYYQRCAADGARAKDYWRRALAAGPAYRRHASYLEEALR
jgi:predicted choloylglycine hydrolase